MSKQQQNMVPIRREFTHQITNKYTGTYKHNLAANIYFENENNLLKVTSKLFSRKHLPV